MCLHEDDAQPTTARFSPHSPHNRQVVANLEHIKEWRFDLKKFWYYLKRQYIFFIISAHAPRKDHEQYFFDLGCNNITWY